MVARGRVSSRSCQAGSPTGVKVTNYEIMKNAALSGVTDVHI